MIVSQNERKTSSNQVVVTLARNNTLSSNKYLVVL